MTTSENRWDVELRIGTGARELSAAIRSPSRCLAINGPSGSGKSTIVRAIAGVARDVRGTLRIAGNTWLGADARVPPWERRLAWSPQDAPLFPHLDVRENLLASARALPQELPEIAEALSISHLLTRRPRHLSGGERHRVALGRALLGDADVWLLDEPFAALDRRLRAQVTAFVAALAGKRGVSVLLVSHDAEDRAAFAAEDWELENGRLERR